MASNSNKRIPTVITPQGKPVTKERIAYKTLLPPDHLDDATRKFLTNIQDNIADATLSHRSDPEAHKVIVQQVTLTKGVTYVLRHGLGASFTGYSPTRTYAGSNPFSASEALNNAGMDTTVYLVLVPSQTGTYDIKVFGG